MNPVYTAGYTGTGYYVGVVGQTYAPESDITNFRNAAGLGAVNLIYDCIDSEGGQLHGLLCDRSGLGGRPGRSRPGY